MPKTSTNGEDGHNLNGEGCPHVNGEQLETSRAQGAMGAGTHTRRHFRFLQRMVEAGTRVAEEQYGQMVDFAQGVMQDPAATRRDKLAAAKLLQSLLETSTKVAIHDDRAEQADEHLMAKLVAGGMTLSDDKTLEVRIIRGERKGLAGHIENDGDDE